MRTWEQLRQWVQTTLPQREEMARQARALAISRRRKLAPFTSETSIADDASVIFSECIRFEFTCNSDIEAYSDARRKTFENLAKDNGLIWG